MKHLYEYPLTRIYQGDFRQHLDHVPTNSLVITDPPYNIGFKYDEYPDNLTDDDYVEMLTALRQFNRLVIIHYPIETMRYILPALGVPDHVGTWCYNTQLPKRFRLINYYGCKPDYTLIRQPYKNLTDKRIKKRLANGEIGGQLYEWWTDIQLVKNVSKGKNAHPCPVPEALIRRIIAITANKGDTILDPFAGSGTPLAAAQSLGYESIGCELSGKYIRMAGKRLNQAPLMELTA